MKGALKTLAETYFKKVFKGYDTEAVDKFIISLSDQYEQKEAELESDLRAAQTENERLSAELSELRALIESTEKEHESELLEKQKEYDELCAEIGEKMIVADTRASEIVKNAEKEAELILTQARQTGENEAKVIRMRAEEEASLLIEETRKKCEGLSAAAEEFRQRQFEMNRSMTETERRFDAALNKLSQSIDS